MAGFRSSVVARDILFYRDLQRVLKANLGASGPVSCVLRGHLMLDNSEMFQTASTVTQSSHYAPGKSRAWDDRRGHSLRKLLSASPRIIASRCGFEGGGDPRDTFVAAETSAQTRSVLSSCILDVHVRKYAVDCSREHDITRVRCFRNFIMSSSLFAICESPALDEAEIARIPQFNSVPRFRAECRAPLCWEYPLSLQW